MTGERWREALGERWRWQLAALAALLVTVGAVTTLRDPDLPLHLAMGEWIVRHKAVPFVEPFAWTRPGAPYFAYSWLAEVLYYLTDLAVGPVGLRLLHGLGLAGAGAAVVMLGGAAGWRPWTTLFVALLNVAVALVTVATLRPQMMLFVLVPVGWALAYRAARGAPLGPTLAAVVAASAVLANTHLLFPLLAATCVVLFTDPPADRRRYWLFPGALVAGWLLSPYALSWPAAFRLNFGENLLFGRFTPIMEHLPGFYWVVGSRAPFALIILALAALPWMLAGARLTTRERVAFGALWLAGLVLFGTAIRGLIVWWLLVLPAAGRAAAALPDAGDRRVRRLQLVALQLFCLTRAAVEVPATVKDWWKEGTTVARTLPSPAAGEAEPAAAWLKCHLPHGAGGRIYTTFNFGSYLTWRLPGYSASVDGRTIFPDSVAVVDAFQLADRGAMRFGVWRSADLAIVLTRHGVAAVLDTAGGWRRVAATDSLAPKDPRAVSLYVTERWWRGATGAAPPAAVEWMPAWTVAGAVCAP